MSKPKSDKRPPSTDVAAKANPRGWGVACGQPYVWCPNCGQDTAMPGANVIGENTDENGKAVITFMCEVCNEPRASYRYYYQPEPPRGCGKVKSGPTM